VGGAVGAVGAIVGALRVNVKGCPTNALALLTLYVLGSKKKPPWLGMSHGFTECT